MPRCNKRSVPDRRERSATGHGEICFEIHPFIREAKLGIKNSAGQFHSCAMTRAMTLRIRMAINCVVISTFMRALVQSDTRYHRAAFVSRILLTYSEITQAGTNVSIRRRSVCRRWKRGGLDGTNRAIRAENDERKGKKGGEKRARDM